MNIANTFNRSFTTIADDIAKLINPTSNTNLNNKVAVDNIDNYVADDGSKLFFNLIDIPLFECEIWTSFNNLEVSLKKCVFAR